MSSFGSESNPFQASVWYVLFCLSGKTELAKQVARYLHKDLKKVKKER